MKARVTARMVLSLGVAVPGCNLPATVEGRDGTASSTSKAPSSAASGMGSAAWAAFEKSNATAPGVTVLATYAANGEIAALVAPYGIGKVGVEGPHAEAPADWYEANHVRGSPDFKPGCDLIAKTLSP